MASDQSRDTATSAQTGAESGGATRQYVPRQAPRYAAEERPRAAALGVTLFAAVLMMMSGIMNILEGIAAIIQGTIVVILPNYIYSLSATGWGWFHVGIGILVLAAGIALFTDKTWARAVGVGVVAISLIVNFVYIPYLPIWSLVLIGLDLAIIWALLTPRNRGERLPT